MDLRIDKTMRRLNLNTPAPRFDENGEYELLSVCKQALVNSYDHGVASSLMFLGRLLEARDNYLGARLFYLSSKAIFWKLKSMHWVPAKEYLNECNKGGLIARVLFFWMSKRVERGDLKPNDLLIRYFRQSWKSLQSQARPKGSAP